VKPTTDAQCVILLLMKQLLRLVLLTLAILTPTVATGAPDNSSLDRHQLQLQLHPAEHHLTGTDRISLDDAGAELVFELAGTARVRAVTRAGAGLKFRRQGSRLLIDNPNPGTEPETISIDFAAEFGNRPPDTPTHDEDPGYGIVASIQPEGTFLSAGTAWYPQQLGHPQQLEISITAPAGYHAVTAGRRSAFQDSTDQASSHWSFERPVNGLALAAGPFSVQESISGRNPVYAYFYRSSATLVAGYLQAAVDYLALYEGLFGPYPFSKFAIVENFYPTGYGFPSWTLLGSSVIQLPFIIRTSLGHEIAHSWWGNGVQVDPREGNWSEGLTTYVADYLYQERVSATAAQQYRLKILRDYATLRDKNEFPPARFSSRYDRQSQVIGYGKVAMLLHMLRRKIGEAAFWAALRATAGEAMGRKLGWSGLIEQFSRTSSQPVAAFLRPWLERVGAPVLSLAETQVSRSGGGWVTRGVLRQQDPPFPLEVPIELTTETGTVSLTVPASETENHFALSSDSRPLTLSVDPEAETFRLLDPREIPASINHLRASKRLVVVTLPGFAAARPALERLLAGLRQSEADIIDLKTFHSDRERDADILFLGSPGPSDLPPVDTTGSEAFMSQTTGDAVITVLRRQDRPLRVAAVYQPGAPRFAVKVAGKIPHYGKFSHLEFSGGTIRDQQIQPTGFNPLTVSLPSSERTGE
jgi:aminopeptidase N